MATCLVLWFLQNPCKNQFMTPMNEMGPINTFYHQWSQTYLKVPSTLFSMRFPSNIICKHLIADVLKAGVLYILVNVRCSTQRRQLRNKKTFTPIEGFVGKGPVIAWYFKKAPRRRKNFTPKYSLEFRSQTSKLRIKEGFTFRNYLLHQKTFHWSYVPMTT